MMYCIQHEKTKLFLEGYHGNSPIWTENVVRAAKYSEQDAKQLIQRLACQSQRVKAPWLKNDKRG